MIISREHLLETTRRVSLLSSDKSNSVKLIFTENQIEVTANSPDVGEAQETLEVGYTGATCRSRSIRSSFRALSPASYT